MRKNKFFKFQNLTEQKYLVHGIFSREFGNISFKFGNKKEVVKNRKKIAKALSIKVNDLYEMNQVHGSNIKILNDLAIEKLASNVVLKTDGLITSKKNVFLMIKTADCFPVIFYDPLKKITAAVHVGWRGAIEKIFLLCLLKMINVFNCRAKDILVGIGPGIGPCCFKHKNCIQEKLPEWKKYIKKTKDNKKAINIRDFIESQLRLSGIKKENIEIIKYCSCCSQKFFSHFSSLRNSEPEGRFATIIGMR